MHLNLKYDIMGCAMGSDPMDAQDIQAMTIRQHLPLLPRDMIRLLTIVPMSPLDTRG